MCALLVPAVRVEEFHNAFQSGHERFLDAMPSGAKPHITDAFKSGNECWASVARSVRSEFHRLIHSLKIFVVYDARRLKLERASHERQEDLVSQAKATRRSSNRIPDRVSQSRVEDELVSGLALKLDAFCEDFRCRRVDLLFDKIDNTVAKGYRATINKTRNIEKSSHNVKGWNLETKSQVQGKISFEAHTSLPLNTRFLGKLCVVGKMDPLMLAADIVANSLYDHLLGLSSNASLNHPSSIDGWCLKDRVYGVRDDAIEDII